MTVTYREFLALVLDKCGRSEDYEYDVDVLELRSSIAFGVGFQKMMDMFAAKVGAKSVQFSRYTKICPGTFASVNRYLASTMFGNMSENSYSDIYGDLGQHLTLDLAVDI